MPTATASVGSGRLQVQPALLFWQLCSGGSGDDVADTAAVEAPAAAAEPLQISRLLSLVLLMFSSSKLFQFFLFHFYFSCCAFSISCLMCSTAVTCSSRRCCRCCRRTAASSSFAAGLLIQLWR